MNPSLLLMTSLILQETLLAHYSIFQARQAGIGWLQIHLTWTLITLIHMVLPYLLGRFLISKSKNLRVHSFLIAFEQKFDLKKNVGNKIFLILLGIVNYVYLNTFILGPLNIKDKSAFVYIFLGDLIWYLLVVSASLKNVNILVDIKTLTLAFLIVAVCMYLVKYMLKKISKRG